MVWRCRPTFERTNFPSSSENTVSDCLFYHKNCSSRNSPFLPTCEQINIWLCFILVPVLVSEAEVFCGCGGGKAFSNLAQIICLFLPCLFSTASPAWSCKFHFLLYVQILLITSTSLTPLLGVPAFLPSVLTLLFLTACTWSVTVPFLSALQSGLVSASRTLWCCCPISKIVSF